MRYLSFALLCVVVLMLSACSARKVPRAATAGLSLPRIERQPADVRTAKPASKADKSGAAARNGRATGTPATTRQQVAMPSESHALGTRADDGTLGGSGALSRPGGQARTSRTPLPVPTEPSAGEVSSLRTTRTAGGSRASRINFVLIVSSAAALLALAVYVRHRLRRDADLDA